MSTSFVAFTGSVENITGGVPQDFVLTAAPIRPYYDSTTLVAQCAVKFSASTAGIITGNIASQQLMAFSANFTANGIYQEILFQEVPTPSNDFDLSEILVPLVNQ